MGESGRRRADGGEEVAARLIESVGLGVELRRRRDRRRRAAGVGCRRGADLGAARFWFLFRRGDDNFGKLGLLRGGGSAEAKQHNDCTTAKQIAATHTGNTSGHDAPP